MVYFNGDEYYDDRLFVLEVRRSITESLLDEDKGGVTWYLITRRNIQGYPPFRVDDFDNRIDAIKYLERVEPEMPRISLNGRSPEPAPNLQEYRQWVDSIDGEQSFIEPEPDLTTMVFEVLYGSRLQDIIAKEQWSNLAWSHRNSNVNISPEAASHLEWRIRPHWTPYLFFKAIMEDVGDGAYSMPWIEIILDKPYVLDGNLVRILCNEDDAVLLRGRDTARDNKEIWLIYGISLASRESLQLLSVKSPFYEHIWALMKNRETDRHWLCLPKPMSLTEQMYDA